MSPISTVFVTRTPNQTGSKPKPTASGKVIGSVRHRIAIWSVKVPRRTYTAKMSSKIAQLGSANPAKNAKEACGIPARLRK